jgi:hypothetical protein
LRFLGYASCHWTVIDLLGSDQVDIEDDSRAEGRQKIGANSHSGRNLRRVVLCGDTRFSRITQRDRLIDLHIDPRC